jgi:cystathionine beta-lyase/cystathionine gamma-synthase
MSSEDTSTADTIISNTFSEQALNQASEKKADFVVNTATKEFAFELLEGNFEGFES